METDKADDLNSKFFDDILNLWVIPEIQKRQDKYGLEKPFKLDSALLIFSVSETSPKVLLNKESQLKARVKLAKDVSVNPGDALTVNDIEDIEELIVPQDDAPDSGYVAFLRFKDKWVLKFDLRYNKRLSNKHIRTANQFLEAAEFSLEKNNLIAFIDNLFSASELLAKAVLLTVPDRKLVNKATRRLIHFRFNEFTDLGNINPEHCKTFNRLANLRTKARYLKDDLSISKDDIKQLLNTVKEMREVALNKISDDAPKNIKMRIK